MNNIVVKRLYENPDGAEGLRILIDGIWPRGVGKNDPRFDLWMKEVAPSAELRKWFSHDVQKWAEFQQRYATELELKQQIVEEIARYLKKSSVVLVYTARNQEHNQAIALKNYLESQYRK